MPRSRGNSPAVLSRGIVREIVNIAINGGGRTGGRVIAAQDPNDDTDDGAHEDDALPQPKREEDEPVRPRDEIVGAEGEEEEEEE